MDASIDRAPVIRINPGVFSRATVENEAGEVEVRLSRYGNWMVHIRRPGETEWRVACNGDMDTGVLTAAPRGRPNVIRFGDLTVLRGPRRVFVGEREAGLSRKEFELLLVLLSDPYRLFTKEELHKSVWGHVPASPTSLNTHAVRLRGKLAAAGAPGLVVNQWKIGYRLSDLPPGSPDLAMPAGEGGGHLAAAA